MWMRHGRICAAVIAAGICLRFRAEIADALRLCAIRIELVVSLIVICSLIVLSCAKVISRFFVCRVGKTRVLDLADDTVVRIRHVDSNRVFTSPCDAAEESSGCTSEESTIDRGFVQLDVVPDSSEERSCTAILCAYRELHGQLHEFLLVVSDCLEEETCAREGLRTLIYVHSPDLHVLYLERKQRVPIPDIGRVRIVLAQLVPVLHDEARLLEDDVPNLTGGNNHKLHTCSLTGLRRTWPAASSACSPLPAASIFGPRAVPFEAESISSCRSASSGLDL